MSFSGTNNITYVKFLLRVFRIFGLVTFSVHTKSIEECNGKKKQLNFEGSYIAVTYNVVLVLLIGSMNYIILSQKLNYGEIQNLSLVNMIDSFEIVFGTFVALLILSAYCFHQQTAIRLAGKVYRVTLLSNQLIDINRRRQSSFEIVSSSIVFHLIMFLILFISGIMYFGKHMHLISSACRNFVVTWMILQYASIVRFLMNTFESINEALADLMKMPAVQAAQCRKEGPHPSVLVNSRKLRFLSSMRDLHYSLLEICNEVIKFYELTILGCVAYVFVCLVVFSYFFIDPIIGRKTQFTIIEYLHFLLWLISFTSAFVTLSKYVTETTNQIEKTGVIIHQLIRNTLNRDILKELKHFSIYLLHIRIKFSACGFFTLDGSLMQSIITSITTYLVILVQFELSSSKKITLMPATRF